MGGFVHLFFGGGGRGVGEKKVGGQIERERTEREKKKKKHN